MASLAKLKLKASKLRAAAATTAAAAAADSAETGPSNDTPAATDDDSRSAAMVGSAASAPDPLDERCASWLGANGLQPASTAIEARIREARGEESDVSGAAESAAWRTCDLVLDAQPVTDSELFDETVLAHATSANARRRAGVEAARAELTRLGVCEEHLSLPPDRLVPLIHEMAYARVVGASAAGKAKRPPAASFGSQHTWPAHSSTSAPPPAESPLVMVVVARHYDADVGWLKELPRRTRTLAGCSNPLH